MGLIQVNDIDYMKLALDEAKKAVSQDEVPVGAVLVNAEGDVLGRGHNQPIVSHDPTAHAEINAMRMAAAALGNYRLVNTTLYVTIEPCIMCMGAIIHQRLNHRPEITAGICADQAQQLIKAFFASKRKKT